MAADNVQKWQVQAENSEFLDGVVAVVQFVFDYDASEDVDDFVLHLVGFQTRVEVVEQQSGQEMLLQVFSVQVHFQLEVVQAGQVQLRKVLVLAEDFDDFQFDFDGSGGGVAEVVEAVELSLGSEEVGLGAVEFGAAV